MYLDGFGIEKSTLKWAALPAFHYESSLRSFLPCSGLFVAIRAAQFLISKPEK
jgi:hypothetical protein